LEVGFITSATASELAVVSSDATLSEMQGYLRRTNLFRLYVVAAIVVMPWAISALVPIAVISLLIVLIVIAIPLRSWDLDRRTARIFYDVDDQEVVERIAIANSVGQALSSATRLWHIFYSVSTDDWKKNAGASALIRRTSIRATVGALPQIGLNIEPWCIPFGPQRLLFLPERLIVWDGKNLAGVPYEDLEISSETTRFIEEGTIPKDSQQVGVTWRYVRRDGGPDLRFNNNCQLAILEYGRLQLSSRSGLKVVLQTSAPAAVIGAANVLLALSRRAVRNVEVKPTEPDYQPAPEVSRDSAWHPPVNESPPESRSDPAVRLALSVCTLLKYIASADRRLAREEVEFAENVIRSVLPAGYAHAEALVSSFRTIPVDAETISMATTVLASTTEQYRTWTIDVLKRLSLADGKATPKEMERLEEVSRALSV
jgi:uncharacterized tellurite resistance protein B-like protein